MKRRRKNRKVLFSFCEKVNGMIAQNKGRIPIAERIGMNEFNLAAGWYSDACIETKQISLSQNLVKTLQFHCSYFSFYKYFEYRTRINDF